MSNKTEFIENMDKEEFEKGLIKFNIPDEDRPSSLNGEGVWGWVTQEDKEKLDDNTINCKNAENRKTNKYAWVCCYLLENSLK